MSPQVSRAQVRGFRLTASHLFQRLPVSELERVAGACGLQNSPPGAALQALHARLQDLPPQALREAGEGRKALLQTWSVRGAPYYFPTSDAAVFTRGVLPPTEAGLRHLLPGLAAAVDFLGWPVADAVDKVAAAVPAVLTGRRLAIGQLGEEVAQVIATQLPVAQRGAWLARGPYAPEQPWAEAVVHFCLRVLCLQGTLCLAHRSGNQALFALTGQWLGRPLPEADGAQSRAELLRRYLRSAAPTDRAGLAKWLGVQVGDVDPWWRLVEDELTAVDYGARRWVLTEDLDRLVGATLPAGVRLLPPRDPYTAVSDRLTLLPRELHREVWKTVGEPGTVLADGLIVGAWRARKAGAELRVKVTEFTELTGRQRDLLAAEAQEVAKLRGANNAVVDKAD